VSLKSSVNYFCNPHRIEQYVRRTPPFLHGCSESSFQSKEVSFSLCIFIMFLGGLKDDL